MDTKIVKVGVIGVGNIGYHHARVYSSMNDVNLVCVCDQDEKKGKEVAFKFKCKYYKNYLKMLEYEDLDAVSIAVPTSLHYEIGLDVLKAKIHVLMEKPLASSTEEALELIKIAKENNTILAVGHIERFNPAVQELKQYLSNGNLGEITSIVAKRVGVLPPQIKDTNVIIDLAIHDIDIICDLLGKLPTEIYASGGCALLSDRLDFADIFLKFGDIGCFIQVNWLTPVKIRHLSVTGTKGYIELNYITQQVQLYQSDLRIDYNDFGDFIISFANPRITTVPIIPREPLQVELESFIKAVKGESCEIVSGEEGLRALKIAELTIKQLKMNR
ncbi:MAG: Gfo/Idh/MocA family oxidoreductase [Candidatus Calescibacterium sp.]|nr:Gfo/Idh/MocA family oxidoreductase [Candidatus Calescibacterium sp.]MDW8133369.1 Gfo/Idh/MocA family oxidoreductase [Candidatus Calescibacterium sp.]